jgi:uncharacterized alpha-E superfamily protein
MWQQVNTFYLMVRETAALGRRLDEPNEFLGAVMQAHHLFLGTAYATMSHGEGWQFARLGRLIERADKTSRILDVKYFILLPSVSYVGTVFDDIQWAAVLRSASAFEMYRKRYGRIDPARVADYLLLDREFPRSVRYCVTDAEVTLRAISGTPGGTFRNRAEQRLGQLRAELDYAQVDEILASGLHEFIDRLQTNLNGVGSAIAETFFAVRPMQGQAV